MKGSSWPNPKLHALSVPVTVLSAVFVADCLHATLLTPATLYPIAVLVCLGVQDTSLPRLVAALGTTLTLIGRIVPRAQPLPEMDLTNRLMTILALWVVAALVLHMNRFQRQLRKEEALTQEAQTLRTRAVQELEASVHKLHDMTVALNQSSIVSMTDREGTIVHVNDKFCQASGFSREELLGATHRIINSDLHPAEFWATVWETIGRGEIWRGEVRNRTKNGQFWWVDTTIVPLLDEQNRPKQYVAVRSDITARKDAEERLREQAALARLGAMASVVAHEVRNPLAGMTGALQIIRERTAPQSEERMVLGDVLERIDQLNLSLTNLLLYARPQAVKKAPTNLRSLLQDVALATKTDPRFAGVEVAVEGRDAVCTLDAHLIRGAVLNLALNAAQAMRGHGRIQLSTIADRYAVSIRIQDDGPGIEAKVLEHIFEPFFTTKARGTGLGLPIVKRVMEQHGGEVHVECPPEGGTVARLDFPP